MRVIIAMSVFLPLTLMAEDLGVKLALAEEAMSLNNPRQVVEESFGPNRNHPTFQHILSLVNYQKVEKEAARLMATTFTEEELRALLAFRRSPTGQAINKKMPNFQKIVGGLIQEELQRVFRTEAQAGRLPGMAPGGGGFPGAPMPNTQLPGTPLR
jgi:hypothetical protein